MANITEWKCNTSEMMWLSKLGQINFIKSISQVSNISLNPIRREDNYQLELAKCLVCGILNPYAMRTKYLNLVRIKIIY